MRSSLNDKLQGLLPSVLMTLSLASLEQPLLLTQGVSRLVRFPSLDLPSFRAVADREAFYQAWKVTHKLVSESVEILKRMVSIVELAIECRSIEFRH